MEVRKTTHIKRPEDIDQISDFFHDCLFDLDDVKHDKEQSCFRIKFRRPSPARAKVRREFWILKEIELPTVECFLNCYQVDDVLINDPVRIGTYSLVDLEYDAAGKTLSIVCAQPLTIQLRIKTLDISVDETDHIVEMKRIKTVFY